MQQREINDLSDHIGRLQTQVEKLRAKVSDLHGRNFQLQRRNAELETLLVKDSHNSSRPPSSDQPWGSGRRVCAARRAAAGWGRPGTMGRRCGFPSALTASSSTGRKSAEAATSH
jgi:uncharacterized coiled-coil protein SlyX